MSKNATPFQPATSTPMAREPNPPQGGDLASRAALAELFYSELSEQYETFAGIGDEHGSETLANLFHLHSAILGNSFVQLFEHAPVIDVLKGLPSNERWLKYICIDG